MHTKSTQSTAWAKGRRIGLICTGLWCVALGIGLIATLVGTDMLASTNTAALLMIVGVIVLPAMTLAAIRQDRRVADRVVRQQPTESIETKVFEDRGSVVHDRHERTHRHGAHAIRSGTHDHNSEFDNDPKGLVA